MPKRSVVFHWYKIPDTTLAAVLREGFVNQPTEIALRSVDAGDNEDVLAMIRKQSLFRSRLVASAICGVNYDPQRSPAARKECSSVSTNPDLVSEAIYLSLPSKILVLVEGAFSKINDETAAVLEDFLDSESLSTTAG